MNLGKYPSAVYSLAEEIRFDFTEEDIKTTFDKLKALGFSGWLEWKQKNHELIVAYLAATPVQREKLKKFKAQKPLLAFGAYQHCLAGYKFLQEIEANFIAPGQSYRGMAASAANAYQQVCNAVDHELWPWGYDPFESDT